MKQSSLEQVELLSDMLLRGHDIEEQCKAAIFLGQILQRPQWEDEIIRVLQVALNPSGLYDCGLMYPWIIRIHAAWGLGYFGRCWPGMAAGTNLNRGIRYAFLWESWLMLPCPSWNDWLAGCTHPRWFVRMFCADYGWSSLTKANKFASEEQSAERLRLLNEHLLILATDADKDVRMMAIRALRGKTLNVPLHLIEQALSDRRSALRRAAKVLATSKGYDVVLLHDDCSDHRKLAVIAQDAQSGCKAP